MSLLLALSRYWGQSEPKPPIDQCRIIIGSARAIYPSGNAASPQVVIIDRRLDVVNAHQAVEPRIKLRWPQDHRHPVVDLSDGLGSVIQYRAGEQPLFPPVPALEDPVMRGRSNFRMLPIRQTVPGI